MRKTKARSRANGCAFCGRCGKQVRLLPKGGMAPHRGNTGQICMAQEGAQL